MASAQLQEKPRTKEKVARCEACAKNIRQLYLEWTDVKKQVCLTCARIKVIKK